jgi:hypothetical protein
MYSGFKYNTSNENLKTHKMVTITKTQFPSKSHHNIALVLLNKTRQQIKSWSPPTSHNDKKWTTNSPP